jgi:hypothetical protein
MTSAPPSAARALGFAGLLPAIAAAAVLAAGPADWHAAAASAHLIYAATIVSFIGGAWWGLASARAEAAALPALLAISVVPSLLGWGFALLGGEPGLLGMAALFLALLPVDQRLVRAGVAPGWWLPLRRPLSLGMALCAAASGVLAG